MSLEKLKQAKQIEQNIEAQKENLHHFTMGKILSITTRTFSERRCDYTDREFEVKIPRSILKNTMIDYLKKDIENLEAKLKNLFKDDEIL